eukprot:CAMPEP_0172790522 /NCGR_PEP_ID=MMETSP1074-20121228/208009_1 /TAXON_ID=2916 /ORGANISM="Ceratium fusus, Strain PA161109" /LENGTH=131 /DNA_ID=CAMNT_0013627573 /DNA_START=570 /DNA_END=962 /DNA_ORIENTATION=-
MANFEHLTMVSEADAASRSLIHVFPLQMQIQVMLVFEYLVANATSPLFGITPFALFLLLMVVVQVSAGIKRTPFWPVFNAFPSSDAQHLLVQLFPNVSGDLAGTAVIQFFRGAMSVVVRGAAVTKGTGKNA